MINWIKRLLGYEYCKVCKKTRKHHKMVYDYDYQTTQCGTCGFYEIPEI